MVDMVVALVMVLVELVRKVGMLFGRQCWLFW